MRYAPPTDRACSADAPAAELVARGRRLWEFPLRVHKKSILLLSLDKKKLLAPGSALQQPGGTNSSGRSSGIFFINEFALQGWSVMTGTTTLQQI